MNRVDAKVEIQELPIKVVEGKYKFLYNMMLSLFESRVKESVSTEISKKVEESLPLLKEKITAAITGLSPELQATLGADSLRVIETLKSASGTEVGEDDDEHSSKQQLSSDLMRDVEGKRKIEVIISNGTDLLFKEDASNEGKPNVGSWVVQPPGKLHPGKSYHFGLVSEGFMSGIDGQLSFSTFHQGKDVPVVLSFTNPYAGSNTFSGDVGAPLRLINWGTTGDFSKVYFEIQTIAEGRGNSVSMRDEVLAENELLAEASSPGSGTDSALDGQWTEPLEARNAQCQYDGSGKFVKVWIELAPSGDLCLKSVETGMVEKSVCVINCAARSPKNTRKGHAHALRLDVVGCDVQAAEKFIFSLGSAAELATWLGRLGPFVDDAAVAPHSDYDDPIRMLAQNTIAESMQQLDQASGSSGTKPPSGQESLNLHIGTWNVGNAKISSQEDLDPWMPFHGRGSDIIVLCTQECTYDSEKDVQQEIVGTLSGKIVDAKGFANTSEALSDRFCQVSLVSSPEPKTSKPQMATTPIWKGDANPAWNQPMKVDFKDDTFDYFRVSPCSARLLVSLKAQVGTTFGKKVEVIAEGELLIDPSSDFREMQDTEVWLHTPGWDGKSPKEVLGCVTLQLLMNVHVELSRLQSQKAHALAAAAAAETQEVEVQTAATGQEAGTLHGTIISANIRGAGAGEATDALCKATVGSESSSTEVAEGTSTPHWAQKCEFLCSQGYMNAVLIVELFDVEEDGQSRMDSVSVPISGLEERFGEDIEFVCESTGSTVLLSLNFTVDEIPAAEPQPEKVSRIKATSSGADDDGDIDDDGSHFFHTVKRAAGDQYYEVGREVLWQMMIIVLAKVELRPDIKSVEIAKVATGIAGIVANKGGIVFKLEYKDCALAFVNTHLAAHESLKHCLERNAMAEVVQRSARVGNKGFDIGNQFQHSFWAGDLNYRVEFPDWTTHEVSKEKKLLQVKQLIEKERWDVLRAADELEREMAAGHVFAGFQDSTCMFPPTFKVEKGFEMQYNDKRVPSYCDRILWRSSRGLERCIHKEYFNAAPNLITSDHKPAWARFKLSIPPSLKDRDQHQSSRVLIRFLNVEAEGLYTNTRQANLEIHDDRLLQEVVSMKDLSGSSSVSMVTRICSADSLCGLVDDPSGSAQSVFFGHSVSLKVTEDGNFGAKDLGYTTMDLRVEGESKTACSDQTVADIEETAPGWKVLRSRDFPVISQSFRLPLSLNGQMVPHACLTGKLEIVELFRPVWTVENESTMRTGFEKSTNKVCSLGVGDQVYCESKKRRGQGKKNIVRMRVRMWGDFPLTQEGWVSEIAGNGTRLMAASHACRCAEPPSQLLFFQPIDLATNH